MANWREKFKEKFLEPGSDCTWKEYPDPEEIMEFIEDICYEDDEWIDDYRK